MNNSLIVFFLVGISYFNTSFAHDVWVSPTEKYLTLHSSEQIKYHLKLDHVTFEQKSLYDKAVSNEKVGFFGYHSASASYRVYQDVIRLIFEEILETPIRSDFHFIAVPLYPERVMTRLDQICPLFFGNKPVPQAVQDQLFPIHLSLYANHRSLGFSPIKNYALAKDHHKFNDLHWLSQMLKMPPETIIKSFEIGEAYFNDENRVLIQFFDFSHESGRECYQVADDNVYPAWPSGHPFQNCAVSDYAFGICSALPPQFFLLLNEREVLNPNRNIVIKRYGKIQPSKLASYEQELRNLIKTATYNQNRRDEYINKIKKSWEQPPDHKEHS